MRTRAGIVVVLLVLAGCQAPRRPAVPTTRATRAVPAPTTSALDADVAALPEGRGAAIALVIDDVGYRDTYLFDYLRLPIPLTFSVIPVAPHAAEDDTEIATTGREVLLHVPLVNPRGPQPPGALGPGTPPAAVDRFVAEALRRVPHAVGANNHEGSAGSTDPRLMSALLDALAARHLFFLDSVTSQDTVGYAVALARGMPPRINNVFCDHLETDADSRQALLTLASAAARNGSAIGIAHVFHPYLVHALQAVGPQLQARGYTFKPLSEVTNRPLDSGLDRGVRTRVPKGRG